MRLLVLRPQPDAARTAAALRARGHEPIVAPLLDIVSVSRVDPGAGPWMAFLLTSANALRGFAGLMRHDAMRDVPVFTVGKRIAQEIRRHGFSSVTSADGNVDDLVRLIAARLTPPARLLYLAGEERSGDLAGKLRARGFVVETVIVYRTVAVEKLPQAAAEALAGGIDGVLHYSRRSAEAYVNAARGSAMLARALSPAQFCLSARIAEPLTRTGAAIVKVAPQPNEAALFGLIGPDPH